jgi:hypothetical protein
MESLQLDYNTLDFTRRSVFQQHREGDPELVQLCVASLVEHLSSLDRKRHSLWRNGTRDVLQDPYVLSPNAVRDEGVLEQVTVLHPWQLVLFLNAVHFFHKQTLYFLLSV